MIYVSFFCGAGFPSVESRVDAIFYSHVCVCMCFLSKTDSRWLAERGRRAI